MGKTALLVLFVAITMINQYKGEPNFACARRGGYCSVSNRCPSLGGYVEKLAFKCTCGKACCKCTDTCPDGSTCMSADKTCEGRKDTNGCCGTRFCCTPIRTTTPEPTTTIRTTTPEPTTPEPTTPIRTATSETCSFEDCAGACIGYSNCEASSYRECCQRYFMD
ncbi:GRN [Mytilus coruscus]|uniref:GRN n=1 Tax=Mytilus coruscus TaxID=42192 RepID=A0A6J8DHI4_MYTCO|nr:GRN [Mytilus coruscus]